VTKANIRRFEFQVTTSSEEFFFRRLLFVSKITQKNHSSDFHKTQWRSGTLAKILVVIRITLRYGSRGGVRVPNDINHFQHLAV